VYELLARMLPLTRIVPSNRPKNASALVKAARSDRTQQSWQSANEQSADEMAPLLENTARSGVPHVGRPTPIRIHKAHTLSGQLEIDIGYS